MQRLETAKREKGENDKRKMEGQAASGAAGRSRRTKAERQEAHVRARASLCVCLSLSVCVCGEEGGRVRVSWEMSEGRVKCRLSLSETATFLPSLDCFITSRRECPLKRRETPAADVGAMLAACVMSRSRHKER